MTILVTILSLLLLTTSVVSGKPKDDPKFITVNLNSKVITTKDKDPQKYSILVGNFNFTNSSQ